MWIGFRILLFNVNYLKLCYIPFNLMVLTWNYVTFLLILGTWYNCHGSVEGLFSRPTNQG